MPIPPLFHASPSLMGGELQEYGFRFDGQFALNIHQSPKFMPQSLYAILAASSYARHVKQKERCFKRNKRKMSCMYSTPT